MDIIELSIKLYNRKKGDHLNKYILQVEGEYGRITAWASSIWDALRKAKVAIKQVNDASYWEN